MKSTVFFLLCPSEINKCPRTREKTLDYFLNTIKIKIIFSEMRRCQNEGC